MSFLISAFRSLITGKEDVEFILEPVRDLEHDGFKAAIALLKDHQAIAETLRRIDVVLNGDIEDEEARKVLEEIIPEAKEVIALIEEFLAKPDPPPLTIVHIVEGGETLSTIARKYSVTVEDILAVNAGIADPNTIFVGQRIVIPDPELPEEKPTKSLRPGGWGINGYGSKELIDLFFSWRPTAITSIFDHLGPNRIFEYKANNPDVRIIVRFMHPRDWWRPGDKVHMKASAIKWGREVAGKWPEIASLDADTIIINEPNLGYESGAPDIPALNHEEFYKDFGFWFGIVAQEIKNIAPGMKLLGPPFAIGHNEDGVPHSGEPSIGWSGYQYLHESITEYCDNKIGFHGYWGDGSGQLPQRLYHPELSTWHAFRWRRVHELFRVQWGKDVRFIIDECGNFQAGHPEFPDQLIWYAEQCLSDEAVLAVTPFLWYDATYTGGPSGNIANSWVQQMSEEQLHNFVERLKQIS